MADSGLRKAGYDPLCAHCRPRQPHIPNEGPHHPHQSSEAEAPVSGGASGALPAGAQKALHQGGSKCLLDKSMYTLSKHYYKALCNSSK